MNSAIDILKTRLGINRFALAGQSGGSTISAALLALGRKDIACAALGSGAFELLDLEYKRLRANGRMVSKMALANAIYDPSSHVANIPADMSRRIFIIGDTTDTRTPFDQQKRYAEALQAAGHHALLIPIEAIGDLDHSAMAYVVPTAGGCLRGTPDDKLVIANAKKSRNTETTELAATQSATGRTALPRPGENTER
jgi:pimeloyl-ACP methyl ester carboxylesterase